MQSGGSPHIGLWLIYVYGLYRSMAYIGLWLIYVYGLYRSIAYIGLWLIYIGPVAIPALAWTGPFKERWGMGRAKPGLTRGLFRFLFAGVRKVACSKNS